MIVTYTMQNQYDYKTQNLHLLIKRCHFNIIVMYLKISLILKEEFSFLMPNQATLVKMKIDIGGLAESVKKPPTDA